MTEQSKARALIEEARELLSRATWGRWFWKLNLKAKQVTLESEGGMRQIVIDFARWGMNGAQPRFQIDGLMQDAQDCAAIVDGREHHASWFQTIDHPDARLIARAPDLLSQFCNELDQQVSQNEVQAENLRHLQELGRVQKEAIEAAIKVLKLEFPGSVKRKAAIEQLASAIMPKGEQS